MPPAKYQTGEVRIHWSRNMPSPAEFHASFSTLGQKIEKRIKLTAGVGVVPPDGVVSGDRDFERGDRSAVVGRAEARVEAINCGVVRANGDAGLVEGGLGSGVVALRNCTRRG